MGKIKAKLFSLLKFYKWFDFTSSNINHYVIKSLKKRDIENFNIVICSSVETFIYANSSCRVNHKKLVYFVQDYENWNIPENILNYTLSHKDVDYITISDDLVKKITKMGGDVSLTLYNGINKNDFFVNIPWNERDRASFLFLYHPSERKGCDLLLRAIQKIHEVDSSIKFSCFSAYTKPENFPSFIHYVYQPTVKQLNNLYNENRYFICSSIYEGFGLTAAEASFSGAIVVTTRNGGVEQFIKNEVTGFVLKERTLNSFMVAIMKLSQKDEELNLFAIESSKKVRIQLDLDINFKKIDSYFKARYNNKRN